MLQHQNIYLVQLQCLPSRQSYWRLPHVKYTGSEKPMEPGMNPTRASLAFGVGVQSLRKCGFASSREEQGIQPALLLPTLSM